MTVSRWPRALRPRGDGDRRPEVPGRSGAPPGSPDLRDAAGSRPEVRTRQGRRNSGHALNGPPDRDPGGLPPPEAPAGRLRIVGVSVRALAASVMKSRDLSHRFPGGCVALDYFGDADLLALGATGPLRTLALGRDLGLPRSLS